MNAFLSASHEKIKQTAGASYPPPEDGHLIVISDLAKAYGSEESSGTLSLADPDPNGDTYLQPPFSNQSPEQVGHNLAHSLCSMGSEHVDMECFVILDKRSQEDGTCLLVQRSGNQDNGEDEAEPLASMRATFKMAAFRLLAAHIYHPPLSEDMEIAVYEGNPNKVLDF